MSYDGKNLKDLEGVMSSREVDLPSNSASLSPLDLNLSYPTLRFVVPLKKGLMSLKPPRIPMLGSEPRGSSSRAVYRFDFLYGKHGWRVWKKQYIKTCPWQQRGAFYELPNIKQLAQIERRGYLANMHAYKAQKSAGIPPKTLYMDFLDAKSQIIWRLLGSKQ